MNRRDLLKTLGAAGGSVITIGSASASEKSSKTLNTDFNPANEEETEQFILDTFENTEDLNTTKTKKVQEKLLNRLSKRQINKITEAIQNKTHYETTTEVKSDTGYVSAGDEPAVTPDRRPAQFGRFRHSLSASLVVNLGCSASGCRTKEFLAYSYSHKITWYYKNGKVRHSTNATSSANGRTYGLVYWNYRGDITRNIRYHPRDLYTASRRKGKFRRNIIARNVGRFDYPVIELQGNGNGYGSVTKVRPS